MQQYPIISNEKWEWSHVSWLLLLHLVFVRETSSTRPPGQVNKHNENNRTFISRISLNVKNERERKREGGGRESVCMGSSREKPGIMFNSYSHQRLIFEKNFKLTWVDCVDITIELCLYYICTPFIRTRSGSVIIRIRSSEVPIIWTRVVILNVYTSKHLLRVFC